MTFETELWRYGGDSAWYFLTVPGDLSDEVRERAAGAHRGFGSVRVRVAVGDTTWSTSVFPDKARAAYVLPVKKDVRRAEGLDAGDLVAVTLELLD